PGLQARRGCRGRIQRQVYVQPVRAAWWIVCHLARSHPTHLPKLLPGRCALAVHGHSPGEGCVNNISLRDLAPAASASREEVLRGLRSPQKELPCKLLYDELGSQLFEQICNLDEYYPTRAEMRIMRASAGQMAKQIGPECMLVEYGSGSSLKTP